MDPDEKKQAREKKFMIDVFMNKPLPKEELVVPVYVKREFTMKQTRKSDSKAKLTVTNTDQYQLFSDYKARITMGDLLANKKSQTGKSTVNQSTTNASLHLESALVGRDDEGRQGVQNDIGVDQEKECHQSELRRSRSH